MHHIQRGLAAAMDNIRRGEGFRGQILHVVPPPTLDRFVQAYLTRQLYVTDVGWFPRVKGHYCRRNHGAKQNILIVCVRGEGWCEIGGKTEIVRPGQALLLPHDKQHAYGASPKNPWSIHWVGFLGDDADYYLQMLPHNSWKVHISRTALTQMRSDFRSMYRCIRLGYAGHNIYYLTHAVRHILGLLFYGNHAYAPEMREQSRYDLHAWIEFMADSVGSPLSLAEMAEHAGLSVQHFASIFRRRTGASPVEFLIHLKIQRACQLLDTTTRRIADVGRAVGYEDPYYFSRIFRKVMATSPSKYRKLRAN
jgi:AraC family transcriptional regulator, arabinose operon regulatory protein